MKLLTYLQALLARFYSKTDADNAEIVALQRLNYQSTQVLLNTDASGVNTQVFTAPSDGVFISYINNGTVYNGISNLAHFETLINFSGQSWGGSNSACWSRVSKGDRIQCHLNTTMETNITVKFVPFMGGVNSLFAFANQCGRDLLCLSFSRCLMNFLSSLTRNRYQKLTQTQLLFLYHRPQTICLQRQAQDMFARTTDMLKMVRRCILDTRRPDSLARQPWRRLLLMSVVGSVRGLEFVRATLSQCGCKLVIQLKDKFGLSLTKDLNRLGGVA